jgi:hypothetical protein
VDPTDRYLKTWKPVDQLRVLSRLFSPLPLRTAAFSTIIAKRKVTARRKVTAEELEARAESNGYRRGAHREKDSARNDGKYNDKTKMNQNVVLDRYIL